MDFLAYTERADGTEPMGTDKKMIIRNLKTPKGGIKRAARTLGWDNLIVQSFTNIFDEKTFLTIYNHKDLFDRARYQFDI